MCTCSTPLGLCSRDAHGGVGAKSKTSSKVNTGIKKEGEAHVKK
jgi:hypothetical protein